MLLPSDSGEGRAKEKKVLAGRFAKSAKWASPIGARIPQSRGEVFGGALVSHESSSSSLKEGRRSTVHAQGVAAVDRRGRAPNKANVT